MTDKHTLTVVINVFDDKYCDIYFFTQEHKKLCSYLMNDKSFQSFVKDSMHYPLFNTKQDNPDIDIKEVVRKYLNYEFARVHNMNIHSYLDFPQSYSLEPAFDIENCVMDEVYVCYYCIGNLYNCSDTSSWFIRVPKLYRADEFVCDDDSTFHLVQEDLEDVISTVRRCGDELETFAGLSLYAVKDNRGIEICPFSIGNKDYFVEKAREHANNKEYLEHKTYVYEYKNGKTNKIYGCVKFINSINVVSLNLEKEDVCNKEDKKEEQNNTYEDRIVLVSNAERRMIVRALGLLKSALNIEEGVCSDDYKESVRELTNIFCEENWRSDIPINSYKVRSLKDV